MTTPNVPVRFEFSVELPGTPDQVWQAIATGPGLTAWSMPTELDERAGGEFVIHMGETSARGIVAKWEPPHRLVLEEAEWGALAGHEGADVTPLVTEYLVEAVSGGSCVLRVVSSAFGTGADWEREFMDDAERYWQPQFENLRLYLTAFPGQQATIVESGAELGNSPAEVVTAMRDRLGATDVGVSVDVHRHRRPRRETLGSRRSRPLHRPRMRVPQPDVVSERPGHRLRPCPRLPVRFPRRRAGRHPGGRRGRNGSPSCPPPSPEGSACCWRTRTP